MKGLAGLVDKVSTVRQHWSVLDLTSQSQESAEEEGLLCACGMQSEHEYAQGLSLCFRYILEVM